MVLITNDGHRGAALVQATEAEQMQKAAAEMLAHHQQLAALEHDRHTAMLHNMKVPYPCPSMNAMAGMSAWLEGLYCRECRVTD